MIPVALIFNYDGAQSTIQITMPGEPRVGEEFLFRKDNRWIVTRVTWRMCRSQNRDQETFQLLLVELEEMQETDKLRRLEDPARDTLRALKYLASQGLVDNEKNETLRTALADLE